MTKYSRMRYNKKTILAFFTLLIIICGYLLFIENKFMHSEKLSEDKFVQVDWSIFEKKLDLIGKIQPGSRITINAPFTGEVLSLVPYGTLVRKGEKLSSLNPRVINSKIKESEANYLRAELEYDKVKNWINSDEVLKAKENLTTATFNLQVIKSQLSDTEKLFENGIVSRLEVEVLRQQLKFAV